MIGIIVRIFKEVLNWSFFKKAAQIFCGFAIVGFLLHLGRMTLNILGTDGWNIGVQAWRGVSHIWKNRDV